MSSTATLFAESVTNQSFFSIVAAKPTQTTGSGSSSGAGSSEGSAPNFGDTLQAAMQSRDGDADQTAPAAKKDVADDDDGSAVEGEETDQREVRRSRTKGHKGVKSGKKTSPADAASQDADDGAVEATDSGATPEAAEASGAGKTESADDAGKPVKKPAEKADATPVQGSPVTVSAVTTTAIVATPAQTAVVTSQQVAASAPVAPGNSPSSLQQPQSPEPATGKTSSAIDAAGQGRAVKASTSAAKGAAVADDAAATPAAKPAAQEKAAKAQAIPQDAGEKASAAAPTVKAAAIKVAADPAAGQDAPPEQDATPDAGMAHPAVANKQVLKPDSGGEAKPSDAPSASPAASVPEAVQPAATGADAAQAAAVDAASRTAVNSAPVQPDAPKPAATGSPVIGAVAAAAPAPTEDSADAAAPAQQSPAADGDQTFEQVAMGLRGKLDARNGTAEIRLEPPNLGSLHVSIQLQNGSLTAQFQSSSDVVRDLLKDNMQKLKTVLEGQGITVDKLAVDAPADKVVIPAAKMPGQNGANNDGRSAGQYTRDQSSGQKRSSGGSGFTGTWRDAKNVPDAPMDVIG